MQHFFIDEFNKTAAAYKLDGKLLFQGLPISIENARGSKRAWHNPHTGENGTTTMAHHYGYIRGTEGTDGDHLDVYVGPDEEATHVYIVDQKKKPEGGSTKGDGKAWTEFDEQKCMLGFPSLEAARKAYVDHYNDERFLGSIKAMPMDEFKEKAMSQEYRGEKVASILKRAAWPDASPERDPNSKKKKNPLNNEPTIISGVDAEDSPNNNNPSDSGGSSLKLSSWQMEFAQTLGRKYASDELLSKVSADELFVSLCEMGYTPEDSLEMLKEAGYFGAALSAGKNLLSKAKPMLAQAKAKPMLANARAKVEPMMLGAQTRMKMIGQDVKGRMNAMRAAKPGKPNLPAKPATVAKPGGLTKGKAALGAAAVGTVGVGLYGAKKGIDAATNLTTQHRQPIAPRRA